MPSCLVANSTYSIIARRYVGGLSQDLVSWRRFSEIYLVCFFGGTARGVVIDSSYGRNINGTPRIIGT